MKTIICFAFVAAALAQTDRNLDPDRTTDSTFNANSVADAHGQTYGETGGQTDKGRLTGVHSSGCPSHSTLTRPPYQDMRDCDCDEGYEAYAWPGWGCYKTVTTFTCPEHSEQRVSHPLSMNDCICQDGFAKDVKDDNTMECVYAYIFHVHGRVWISGDHPTNTTLFDESDFKNAMADAINATEVRWNEKPCPGNFNGTITKEECEAARDPLTDTLMNCQWSDTDTHHNHLHTKTENASQVTAGEFNTVSNNAAQCFVATASQALTRAEEVSASDILPYNVRSVANIKQSLTTWRADGKIVLAESDSDAKNALRHTEQDVADAWTSGVTIGFAIKLKGTSMEYGNALVNVMKKPSLAADFKANYGATPSGASVHIFVWALTAEFWRSEPKATTAPYTWAPRKSYTHTGYQKPANYTPPPTPEPVPLSPDAKATVNMALTVACQCDDGTDMSAVSHTTCLMNHDFLSMYEFVDHDYKFRESVAQILFGAPNASLVEVASVSPAGLHPHDVNSWSPVHSHENANGVEIHFKVAADEWGDSSTAGWQDANDHGLYNIKKRFDEGFYVSGSTKMSFAEKLATQLQQDTSGAGSSVSNAWNVPKQCIMKNVDPVTQTTVKAYWTMKHWQKPTHAPTPPPTPVPLGTPGRRPNCASGPTVTIQGHAEILSPAPVSGEAEGTERKALEDTWLSSVRQCMAQKLDAHYNVSDPNEKPLEMCNILVSYGPSCNATPGAELPELCQECIDGRDDPELGPQNWDLGEDQARCNGLLRYEGEIYQRPTTNSTVEQGNPNSASRRLLGKLASGQDPNRPLRIRHEKDGQLTVYRFNFEINSPSADMNRGNGLFSQIQYRKDGDGKSEFVMDVNECLLAGHVQAPKFENGMTYRPSVPTVSIMQADSLAYHYIEPQATTTTAAPGGIETECQITWSEPTACSKTCGGGKSYKFGLVTQAQVPHNPTGDICNYPNGSRTLILRSEEDLRFEDADCASWACPVSCTTGAWNDWGGCSQTCGGGVQTRQREVDGTALSWYNRTTGQCTDSLWSASAPGGHCATQDCGQMEQTRTCDNFPCPQNCTTTEWGEWGTCSKRCQEEGETPGEQWRRRTIIQPAYYGGADCGDLTEKRTCNLNACPVNCIVSQWSEWGTCNENCAGRPAGTRLHGAKQERTRYIVKAAENGGHQCPALVQTKLCALHPCGAHVCTTSTGFPLTCTYENNIVYTHHVNDVHDDELFMCYHNYVTQVCTCLCWKKASIKEGTCHNVNPANDVEANSCLHNNGKVPQLESECTAAATELGMTCNWVGNVARTNVTTGNVNDLMSTYPAV